MKDKIAGDYRSSSQLFFEFSLNDFWILHKKSSSIELYYDFLNYLNLVLFNSFQYFGHHSLHGAITLTLIMLSELFHIVYNTWIFNNVNILVGKFHVF